MSIRQVLLVAHGHGPFDGLFAAALEAARIGPARIDAVFVRADPLEALQFLPDYYDPSWLEQTMAEAERNGKAQAEAFRQAVDHWCTQAKLGPARDGVPEAPQVAVDERVTSLIELLRERGPYADLIVMQRPNQRMSGAMVAVFETAVFATQRPFLLVPPAVPVALARGAVIGWNGSPEALHAVTGALPLLRAMKRVTVVSAQETADEAVGALDQLMVYLATHGVAAEIKKRAFDGMSAGSLLLAEVAAAEAGLLVMGAYTHSRLREAVFGGATRHVLENAVVPLLMAH